jgi:hypothetical protein
VARRPSAALREFLAAYDPAITRLYLAARKAVLEAAPDANELIYDAYNAVTSAYSFTERLAEAFCHVAAYRKYVNLGFNRGAGLPDPGRILVGEGARIRHVRIERAADLSNPAVRDLLREAVAQGREASHGAEGSAQAIVKATYAVKRRPA